MLHTSEVRIYGLLLHGFFFFLLLQSWRITDDVDIFSFYFSNKE